MDIYFIANTVHPHGYRFGATNTEALHSTDELPEKIFLI